MIKTISKAEFRKLKDILKAYYDHIKDHSETLITRVFGMHMIKWKSEGVAFKKYLVVMNNIFEDIEIGNKYDLKGSTVGRRELPNDEAYTNPLRNAKIALKDLDFIRHVGHIQIAQDKLIKNLHNGHPRSSLDKILAKDA